MIIITPNSFKKGFLDEIEKHGFVFDVHVWRSNKKDAAARWFDSSGYGVPRLLIINYEAVRMLNVTAFLLRWAQSGKTYLTIDESIQIKGNRTAQTKAVHALARWSPYTNEPMSRAFRSPSDRQAANPRLSRFMGPTARNRPLSNSKFLLFSRDVLCDGRLADEGGARCSEHRTPNGSNGPSGFPSEEERLAARLAAQGRDYPRLQDEQGATTPVIQLRWKTSS